MVAPTPSQLQQSTSKGNKNVDWEVPRKIFHSSQGLFIIFLYCYFPTLEPLSMVPLLLPIFLMYFYLDHLRLVNPSVNSLIVRNIGITMRPAERLALRLTSSSAYMAGILLTLCWWRRDVATLACLFLAFVDTAAAFGGRAGKIILGKKNYTLGIEVSAKGIKRTEKSVCGFTAAVCTAACIYATLQHFNDIRSTMTQITLAGLIGGIAEIITISGIDDDLSLPIISGLLLNSTKMVLKIF